MLIDAGHRRWFLLSFLLLAAASAGYVVYARSEPRGPGGDTWIGLAYGVAAALMVLFAAVLGARKKLFLLRFGSLKWWMKGHLWLGALSLPMALFHGAFEFGGPLTTVLMGLLIAVVASGVLGALLQHFLPRAMAAQVEREATHEAMRGTMRYLRAQAYALVTTACGPVDGTGKERKDLARVTGKAPGDPKEPEPVAGQEAFKKFYVERALPFLRRSGGGRSPLAAGAHAVVLFERLRTSVDPSLHEQVSKLEDLCTAVRERQQQARLHRWLHAWLLVHLPLSMALLVLMVAHAVMALYYAS